MKRKPSKQVCLKRYFGRCLLCPQSQYEALQCHRVIPGEDGGTYAAGNIVVLCSSCHSIVTAGVIKIDRLCRSSSGLWVAPVTDANGLRWIALEPKREC